jgi:P-type E1-E2 ATPase
MVKKWGITLAIGDGANDVNMINGAKVGVGVRALGAVRQLEYLVMIIKNVSHSAQEILHL